jgi:RimJ/RimL family protein N-acetyltransferase
MDPDNTGSQRVAQKNGFQREGVMRGAWLSAGRYQDVQSWSIVHDDVIDGGQT